LTGSAPATLNSISLYLGRIKNSISYASGSLYLDIYIAKPSTTLGLYVPDLSTTKLATASVDVSTLAIDAYPSKLTSFTYTGVNAITLSANTNYTFYINATNVSFEMVSGIRYRVNNSNPYTNGNMFNSISNPNGSSSIDMSGQIDVTYAAVPEPGTMILFGVTMAIGGAVAVIRNRRKRNAD
jgi:hypothetical protein